MSFHRPIRGQTEDLGPLVRLPCSQCDAVRWFHLKQHSVSTRVLGFALSKSSAHSLHCVKCEYEIDIPNTDVEKAIAFLPIAQEFAVGKAKEGDFLAKLEHTGFTFLKQFAAANTNWKCDNCGEESPLTFPECWNCGDVREGAPAHPESDEPNTPYLNRVLGNEGGPFGPMKL